MSNDWDCDHLDSCRDCKERIQALEKELEHHRSALDELAKHTANAEKENKSLRTQLEEKESKIAEYHDSYEGKKHRIYDFESRLSLAVEALKRILVYHPHPSECDYIHKECTQALQNLEGGKERT